MSTKVKGCLNYVYLSICSKLFAVFDWIKYFQFKVVKVKHLRPMVNIVTDQDKVLVLAENN